MKKTYQAAVLLSVLGGALAQETATIAERFPPSSALAEGLSPEALESLGALVQSFVDDDEIVGGELLVIRNGRTVMHEGYGWRDRDGDARMEPGTVFCVRSMTKPLVGAAIQMLIADDLLELDDPVAEYLPSFDAPVTRDITVEMLLTHTSGLPMSFLIGRDLTTLEGIRAVADLSAGKDLEFDPGSEFSYSDQGTDTLTALIEVVTGAPADRFVRARILEPLGMGESACVLTEGHALRGRASSKYNGGSGAWTRFWAPEQAPLFPFFLGSQGLYSTTTDYARFLDLFMRKGRAGGERLLGRRAVTRTLTPGPHPMNGPSGLPGISAEYGSLMQLWTRPGEEGEEPEVVAFGHTGSDGTHAWAFPEQKTMVLYFTQSRGTGTGLRVEEQLGDLLLGVPFDPIQAAPPLEQYLGYYFEGENDQYRSIILDGDGLALEVVGKGVAPLTYVGEDRWKLRPGKVLAFDRSEAGEVTGYHIDDHQEFRFEPSAELPTAEEVAERIAKTHRMDLLKGAGAVRMHGQLTIEKLGITGTSTTWLAWPNLMRSDEVAGGEAGGMAFDGEDLWFTTSQKPRTKMEGEAAELLHDNNPFARFGSWHEWYPHLEVIQRIQAGDDEVLLVRAGDTSGHADTLYVDMKSWRVGRVDGMTFMEGLGRVGHRTTFRDFRDVVGALLPHRTEVRLANPLIGVIVTTVDEVETGVELGAGHFELR